MYLRILPNHPHLPLLLEQVVTLTQLLKSRRTMKAIKHKDIIKYKDIFPEKYTPCEIISNFQEIPYISMEEMLPIKCSTDQLSH